MRPPFSFTEFNNLKVIDKRNLFLLPESEYRRRASPNYRGRFFLPRRYIASRGKIYTLDIFTRLLGRTLKPKNPN